MAKAHKIEVGRPTPERLRHAGNAYEVAESRGSAGTMTMRDCPLERAFGRGQLEEREYQAGIKFRHHWFHAGMAGQITSLDMDRVFARDLSSMGHMPKSEKQLFHRQRYREACDEMGQRQSQAVEDCVCAEIEFEKIGRKFGFNNDPQARACAVTLIRDGLYRLAKIWGL
jgi:hypothetical protein